MQAIPLCPITGLPAERRIQSISARLIRGLWRGAFGVSTDRQLAGIDHFGLWESPCGSVSRIARAEFRRIAELVRPGDKVLDVGCGEGALAPHLPLATYVRLDPHCYANVAELDVRSETIAAHAASHPEEYDAVCAFHSIEHVADPLDFARDLVKCVRRGGRLCIVVPSRTSTLTEIPNFVLNAPPNHFSWWDEGALSAVAGRLGLKTEAIETAPFSFDNLIYLTGRWAPKLTGDRYFRAHWTWYCALAWSWLAGRACDALFSIPASARPSGLLLIARKPS
jgi:SAM-dependent methyltransferase